MSREHELIEELRRARKALASARKDESEAKAVIYDKKATRVRAESLVEEILTELETGKSSRPILDAISGLVRARGAGRPPEPEDEDTADERQRGPTARLPEVPEGIMTMQDDEPDDPDDKFTAGPQDFQVAPGVSIVKTAADPVGNFVDREKQAESAKRAERRARQRERERQGAIESVAREAEKPHLSVPKAEPKLTGANQLPAADNPTAGSGPNEWHVHRRTSDGKIGGLLGTVRGMEVTDAAMSAMKRWGDQIKLGRQIVSGGTAAGRTRPVGPLNQDDALDAALNLLPSFRIEAERRPMSDDEIFRELIKWPSQMKGYDGRGNPWAVTGGSRPAFWYDTAALDGFPDRKRPTLEGGDLVKAVRRVLHIRKPRPTKADQQPVRRQAVQQ